jgi:2-keto-4-pentenoate hydratase/2-oxohepta-3-ene-1,7-dioic acid hydratase in catechol pathway
VSGARIARVRGADGAVCWAVDHGDGFRLADGDPFDGGLEPRGPALVDPVFDVPCRPSKILAVARNYRKHAAELGNAVPEGEPLYFYKPPSALLATGGVVRLPRGRGQVDYEGELAVVIGRRCRDLSADEASSAILGLSCAVDVTARAVQRALGHFSLAKGFDGFCPLGPWIATGVDPRDLRVRTRLGGRTVQDGRSSEMVHPVPSLIAFLSSVVTLEPGDVILTGTPAGVGPLSDGDRLEVEVEDVGVLTVSIAAEA